MKNFEFAIIASGRSIEDENFLNTLFESGCDDATISFQKGVIIAEFDREAVSFSRAIATACEQIHNAGAKIERIEPDHLVSISEIAERCDLSRQAISLYIKGKRLKGFPNPTAKVTSKHALWDWFQVADWLFKNGFLEKADVVQARIVKEANTIISASDIPKDGFAKRLEEFEQNPNSALLETNALELI